MIGRIERRDDDGNWVFEMAVYTEAGLAQNLPWLQARYGKRNVRWMRG
jgi:hypothetical protein